MEQGLSAPTLLTASPDLESIDALPDEFQGWRVICQLTDVDAGWSRHVFIPVRLYRRRGFWDKDIHENRVAFAYNCSFMLFQDSL